MSFARSVLLVGLLGVAACSGSTTDDAPSVTLEGADKLTADRLHSDFASPTPTPSECNADEEHFEITVGTHRLVATRCTDTYRSVKTDRVLDDAEYRSITTALARLEASQSECKTVDDGGPLRQLVLSKPSGDTNYLEDADGCPRKDWTLVSNVPELFKALEALVPLH